MRTLVAVLLAFSSPFILAADWNSLPSVKSGLSPNKGVKAYEVRGLAQKASIAKMTPHEMGTPFQFAVSGDFSDSKALSYAENDRRWIDIGDDLLVKRIRVSSTGAMSLNLGFSDVFLPHGASLYLYDPSSKTVRGPFTEQQNRADGLLFTPLVPGDSVVLELVVPRKQLPFLRIKLITVNHGFADIANTSANKSGSCNIDVACPEGDPWREEIGTVARYTISGNALCTGQLMNTTAGDDRLLFLTADHCGINSATAGTLVFYWEFENATCRVPGTAGNSDPLSANGNSIVSMGADFIAGNDIGDFTLVELSTMPSGVSSLFWSGWDRSDVASNGVVGIHHPSGDAKRISFDNDPQTIITQQQAVTIFPNSHLQITNWDMGTTEGGSSGSGIWNGDHHLVGTLSGGFAACSGLGNGANDNDRADWYGRLAIYWDQGSTVETRAKEWLDPVGTGALALDGTSGCDQPNVTISSDTNPAVVGQAINFNSQVSGGTGPYTYAWDVDNNSGIDSTDDSVLATYPAPFAANVFLRVTDAIGCSRTQSLAQSVAGPTFSISTNDNPTQLCGDGDATMEPGERWRIPFQLNNDSIESASGLTAMFARTGGATDAGQSGGTTAPYVATTSADGSCGYEWLEISSTGTSVDFLPATSFSALDDGAAVITLAGNASFELFGGVLSQLAMSTNGFLSADLSDDGGDFDNDCPIPAVPNLGGGDRIYVLHDDLIVDAGFYQYFDPCPRAGDNGGSSGCHVMQWQGAGTFDNSNSENFAFEVLLYEGSNEIVYQYASDLAGVGIDGSTSTVGIQNAAADGGLLFACDTAGSVVENSSVCFSQPTIVADGVHIETPLYQNVSLAAGQSIIGAVDVAIDSDYVCGNTFEVNLAGIIHDSGNDALRQNLLRAKAGGETGLCDNSAVCPSLAEQITPTDGLWSVRDRLGSGIDGYIVDGVFFGLWYTGDIKRNAVWYWFSDKLVDNQVQSKIYRVNRVNDIVATSAIGEATIVFSSETKGQFFFQFDDGSVGGQYLDLLLTNPIVPGTDRSGVWHFPAESGWSVGIHTKGSVHFAISFVFDLLGVSSWTVGTFSGDLVGLVNMFYIHGSCPDCAQIGPTASGAGTINAHFSGPQNGTLSTDLILDGENNSTWIKDAVPIELLSVPE